MKSKLLKATLALFAMIQVGEVKAQNPFDGQAYVSTETTWIFDGETVSETETTGVNQTSQNTGLYNRSKSSGCGFTFAAVDGGQHLTFSDGYQVTVNTVAKTKATDANFNYLKEIYAGTSGSKQFSDSKKLSNYAFPYFAFNASVPGTCYAYVKAGTKNSAAKKMRIQFYQGDGSETNAKNGDGTETTDLVEMKCTSTVAGVFFIGSTTSALATDCEIYAIRFVPTEGAGKYVYIGTTGYATFSDANKNYSTPTGLSAYGAKAADGGNAVELIPATNIKKQNGYILAGTPNTNYKLTELTTGPAVPTGNEMARNANEVTFNVDENGYDSSTSKYNYILAADNGVAKFFAVENGTTLAVGKAWLQTGTQLTPSTGARGISIIFDDNTTNIKDVISLQAKDRSDYYNLAGQRVKQPTKGLYIVNGKKIMVK